MAQDNWIDCAEAVKKAINDTDDPREAFLAASEWASKLDEVYRANAREGWTSADDDRLEELMKSYWDETVGQYLDPAALAYSMSLTKYFPQVAAILEWTASPVIVAFRVLLAPSPIANAFTEALPVNEEVSNLLKAKFPELMGPSFEEEYSELFKKSYQEVKGGPLG